MDFKSENWRPGDVLIEKRINKGIAATWIILNETKFAFSETKYYNTLMFLKGTTKTQYTITTIGLEPKAAYIEKNSESFRFNRSTYVVIEP